MQAGAAPIRPRALIDRSRRAHEIRSRERDRVCSAAMSYPTIGDGHKTGGRVVLPGTTRFDAPRATTRHLAGARGPRRVLPTCNAFDFNEGICNHLTVMVPGTTDALSIPYGLMWDEVTASNLLLLDESGTISRARARSTPRRFSFTSTSTRRGGLRAAPHQPYASAICCLRATTSDCK